MHSFAAHKPAKTTGREFRGPGAAPGATRLRGTTFERRRAGEGGEATSAQSSRVVSRFVLVPIPNRKSESFSCSGGGERTYDQLKLTYEIQGQTYRHIVKNCSFCH